MAHAGCSEALGSIIASDTYWQSASNLCTKGTGFMKTASNPSMVGSSRQCMLREASCCRCLNRSFEVPAERLRYPEESRKTTSNEEWKESRGGWRRVKV